MLKKDILTNFENNFSRLSKYPIEILILIIKISNKNFSLFVNYSVLKKLIIKNQHSCYLLANF